MMDKEPQADYSILEHRHNFASWCAARAYGRGLPGGGNETAFTLIKAVGLQSIQHPDDIGSDVDAWLIGLMRRIVVEGQGAGLTTFRFGHAQKIVNIYLKALFVCGGHHCHPAVQQLHPPLDDILLRELRTFLFKNRKALGRERESFLDAQRMGRRWTQFSETAYTAYIRAIKSLMRGRPLYLVEEHWDLAKDGKGKR